MHPDYAAIAGGGSHACKASDAVNSAVGRTFGIVALVKKQKNPVSL